MAKSNTVEFTIQVAITANDLRDIIEDSVAEITESFAYEDKGVRKQVEQLKKDLFNDDKFRAKVADYFTKQGKDWINSELEYGDARFESFPTIARMRKDIIKFEEAHEEQFLQDLEQQKIKNAIKILKEQGYAVQKAA